jgi:hypothetical protein
LDYAEYISLKENPKRLKYHPYGYAFTIREKDIIQGKTVEDLHRYELRAIIKKAEKLKLQAAAEVCYEKIEEITNSLPAPKYTLEESLEILQRLTPWERGT